MLDLLSRVVRNDLRCLAAAVVLAVLAPATSAAAAGDGYGVLVMAHGGDAEWNAAVTAAVSSLDASHPIEIAFGMADATTLQTAVAALERRGVRRIGVVRLFVSGESWWERTRQILGLDPGAPPAPPAAEASSASPHGHHGRGGHDPAAGFWRIETSAAFALSREGLSEAEEEMARVISDRARALSADPRREVVLILAHGSADDAENERVEARLRRIAASVGAAVPFAGVEATALREDWPEKRAAAERHLRAIVESARAAGRRTLVVPFRVQGFGPYARVLDGLEYVADGRGLLPHPEAIGWIATQAEALRGGPFEAVLPPPPAAPSSAADDHGGGSGDGQTP